MEEEESKEEEDNKAELSPTPCCRLLTSHCLA
jgi:hypothetical protein